MRSAAPTRRLIALVLVATVAFFATYCVAVLTETGQRADEAALTGGRQVPERAQDAADSLLRVVSIGSLVAAITALSGLALLRGDPRLLVVPIAIVGLSLAATEVLKHWLLERPELVVDPKLAGNSYPSGHTTVFASIGLAALIIAPPRLRGPAALFAVASAAGAGVLVVTADWHRPSDPIGSCMLTLAVAAGVLAWLQARGGRAWRDRAASGLARPRAAQLARRVVWASGIGAAAMLTASIMIASIAYGPDVDWNRFHAAYLVSSAAIVAVAGACVAALLHAMGEPLSVAGRGHVG